MSSVTVVEKSRRSRRCREEHKKTMERGTKWSRECPLRRLVILVRLRGPLGKQHDSSLVFASYQHLNMSSSTSLASSSVLLIIGAGANIGQSVADAFVARGWRVASAARSRHDHAVDDARLDLHVDLSKPETVPTLFAKVKAHFGRPPSAVVYNGEGCHG